MICYNPTLIEQMLVVLAMTVAVGSFIVGLIQWLKERRGEVSDYFREPKKVRTRPELEKSCRMLREHNEKLKATIKRVRECKQYVAQLPEIRILAPVLRWRDVLEALAGDKV